MFLKLFDVEVGLQIKLIANNNSHVDNPTKLHELHGTNTLTMYPSQVK